MLAAAAAPTDLPAELAGRQPLRPLSARTRALLCLAWMSPVLIIPAGTAALTTLIQSARPGSAIHIVGFVAPFDITDSTWPSLVLVAAVCYAACFEMWRRVERWRNPKGAAKRAALRVPVIIATNAAAAIGIWWFAGVVASALA